MRVRSGHPGYDAVQGTSAGGGGVRTIAVINRKGGSGKTTTAVNTAAALSEMGLSVLLIDLDPQGSASEWLDRTGTDEGMFQSFMGTGDLARLAVPTDVPGLDLIPASSWLVTAERSLMGDLSLGISRAILGLPRRWAFVIVDCPPSLSYLSIGVLMAVRELVIPVEAHGMALSGADAVIDELPSIRSLNPDPRCHVRAALPGDPDHPRPHDRRDPRGRPSRVRDEHEDPRDHQAPGGGRGAAADHASRAQERRHHRLPGVRPGAARTGTGAIRRSDGS